jgi:DinB superfamily
VNFDLELATEVLERTPAAVHAMLGGLSEPWVGGREGPGTFSPFDVVGHLIDGEETDWMPRARIILKGRGTTVAPLPHPPLARYAEMNPASRADPVPSAGPLFEPYDRFRHKARNVDRTMSSLLAEFARLRADNLTELRDWRLGPAELGLPGTHPSLGPVTLRQLLAAWVVHDLEHVAQAARVMAKQYGLEVGPWVPFLPVLTDHPVPRS